MSTELPESPPEEKPAAAETEVPPFPPPQQEIDLIATIKAKALNDAGPWVDYAMQQALIYQKTMKDTLDDAINISRSRLSDIFSTASAHSRMTLDSLEGVKSEIGVYEDMLFGKIKEGVNIAASHPLITAGVATGLGLVAFKRPRRLLYYNTMRLFSSEESLVSRADAQVKELRQAISKLQAETEKVEILATSAEEKFIRGRTKLRQAGKQIQGAIRSGYKVERQAEGLKDVLRELPGRHASTFRSQVSKLASEAKQKRNALTKVITKISNYGISV